MEGSMPRILSTVLTAGAFAAISTPAIAQSADVMQYPMAKTYSSVEEALADSRIETSNATYQGTTYTQTHASTPSAIQVEIFDTPLPVSDGHAHTASTATHSTATYNYPSATTVQSPTYSYPSTTAHSFSGATTTYVVKPGDNLYRIGVNHGVKASQIMRASGLSSNALTPGQVLTIPAANQRNIQPLPQATQTVSQANVQVIRNEIPIPSNEGYRVLKGDTLFSIARGACGNVSAGQIASNSGIDTNSTLSLGQYLTIPGGYCGQQ